MSPPISVEAPQDHVLSSDGQIQAANVNILRRMPDPSFVLVAATRRVAAAVWRAWVALSSSTSPYCTNPASCQVEFWFQMHDVIGVCTSALLADTLLADAWSALQSEGAHHGALEFAVAHLPLHLIIWLGQPVQHGDRGEQSAKREFTVSMTFLPNEW
jgi:hypothetical protein